MIPYTINVATEPTYNSTNPGGSWTITNHGPYSNCFSAYTFYMLNADGGVMYSWNLGGYPGTITVGSTATYGTLYNRSVVRHDLTGTVIATFYPNGHASDVDTTAPTAPSVALAVWDENPDYVKVSWSGSTDDVGVTGYRYRCEDAASWIAYLGPGAATCANSSLDHAVSVQARDAAGNWSASGRLLWVPASLPTGQTFGPTGSGTFAENPTGCCADPVNTATGSFFDTWHDLTLPGAGVTTRFSRSYNSADTSSGALGTGWTHAYEASLSTSGSTVTVRTGTGQQVTFADAGGGTFAPAPGIRARLSKLPDGNYTLTTRDQERLTFSPTGQMLSHVDRSGAGLGFAYAAGRLSAVIDAAGRSAGLAYTAGGQLESITLADGRHVDYGYADGRLTSVTDARGKTTSYSYDSTGLLASATDPLGQQPFRNTYDPASGRVTSQLDANNHATTFTWDASSYTSRATDARGGVLKHVYSAGNVLLAVTDAEGGVTRYSYDQDLSIRAVVDPRGHRTTMTYDTRGNLLKRTAPSPLNYTETFTYNANNDPLTALDRRGKTTTYTYDATGRPATITDRAAGVTSMTYTTQGQLHTVTDPRNGVTTYGYDNAGNRISLRTPMGRVTTHGYDSSGRKTSTVDPRGNVTGADPLAFTATFTYDAADAVLVATDARGNTTTRTYDDAGRLATIMDPKDGVTTYGYDNADRVTTVTAPDLTVSHRGYDQVGNLTSETTALGHKTTHGYDLTGRRTSTTSPRGNVLGANAAAHTWTYVYDLAGNLTTASHPSAGTTTTVYDEINRAVSVTDGNGKTTVTTYDGNNNPVTVTDPLNAVTTTAYDAVGNRTSVTTPLGHITRWTYNADQQPATVIDARGNVAGGTPAGGTPADYTTTWGYDPAGQRISETDPLANTTATEYDPAGNVTARVDAKDRRTTYEYDQLNRLTKVTGPDLAVTSYTYDNVSNLISRTDANLHVTSYDYDDDRRLTQTVDPMSRIANYGYDPDGNPTSRETPLGTATPLADDGTVTAAYDPLGRVSTVDYSDTTPDVAYTYDLLGRVTAMADGAGTGSGAETYTYDPLHRLKTVTRNGTGFAYNYDLDGRLTQRTYPDGTVVDNGYDNDDRLTTVTSAGTTTTLGYDPAAQLTSTTFPASVGAQETRQYDRAGRLTEVATVKGATVVSKHVQTLDGVGNPLTRAITRGNSTTNEVYSYDNANRLLKACAATSCTAHKVSSLTYTYDGVGNRTSQVKVSGNSTVTSTYAYNNADQLLAVVAGLATTTYLNDANGRQTAAGTRAYTWGLDDRLSSTTSGITTTSYSYDGAGRRLTEATDGTVGTRFAWDIADPLPMLAAESNAAGATTRRYLNRPGTALAVTTGAATNYYGHDQMGSVSDVLSPTGAAQWRYEYDPFGAARSTTKVASTAAANPLQYTGGYLDAVTGQYHLRARQYDTGLGRFLSTDPVKAPIADPYVSAHVYANNRPGVYVDPTGEYFEPPGFRALREAAANKISNGTDWFNRHFNPMYPMVNGLGQGVEAVENGCSTLTAIGHGLRGTAVSAGGIAFAGGTAKAGGWVAPKITSRFGRTAAKSVDEVAGVGHAGIHQFPGITPGKSQFFDGVNLGSLSKSDGLTGVLQKSGNTRYVMRGSGDVGVDAKTGLPTDIYTVIRKPDGSVLTMFPGTSKFS